MEPTEIRTMLIRAMQLTVATAVMNDDIPMLQRANTCVTVVSRLTDAQINLILVDLEIEQHARTS